MIQAPNDRPDHDDEGTIRGRADEDPEAVPDWEGLLDPESGVNTPTSDADAPPPG